MIRYCVYGVGTVLSKDAALRMARSRAAAIRQPVKVAEICDDGKRRAVLVDSAGQIEKLWR